MVALITAAGKGLQPTFDLVNISLLYLLPVLISGVRWGLWPSLAASFLGILSFDYFFVPPVMSFTVTDIRHLLNFAIFLLVALVTGTLASRLRAEAGAAGERERRTAALYALSRRIAVETDMQRVLQAVVDKVAGSAKIGAAILMPGSPYNKLTMVAHSQDTDFLLEQKQLAMAQWVFEHGRKASSGTHGFGAEKRFFIPIAEGTTSLAVLALEFGPHEILSQEQQKDLEAFASLTALAITRVRLASEAEQAQWLLESEKLHRAVLNAVSHDLRTPLSSITGAVTGLIVEGDRYDEETRNALLRTINEGAQRMNRFITNLLNMARIESGILKPNREWCDMLDIVGVAAKEVRDILPEGRLGIAIPAELPLVEADFGLIEQVLINLLENAVKYSPADSTISLSISAGENELRVAVVDHGSSIPESNRERIFDKFYRLRYTEHVAGTGLGLSISRAMIEAHGGRLWVEPGPDEGNVFLFALPVAGSQPESIPAPPEGGHGI
jgi:two-component system, OmpR family, sensor histidine kinase KdpD